VSVIRNSVFCSLDSANTKSLIDVPEAGRREAAVSAEAAFAEVVEASVWMLLVSDSDFVVDALGMGRTG